MTSENNIGNLENEALKRKERLQALKRGNIKIITSESTENTEAEDSLKYYPKPLFRNYTPKDDQLKPRVLPKPDLIEIENEIKEQLSSGKPAPLIENEIDLATLAPQKIDWDLKRDAEKRLRVLEKRTQKAIIELIKDRLKEQKNTDFAELVSIGTRDINLNKDKNEKINDKNEESDSDSDDENDNDNQENDSSPVRSPFELNTKTEISDDDDY